MAKAKKAKSSKSNKQGVVMALVFVLVVIAIVIAVMIPPNEPPQKDAKNPKEEIIENYVWQVYGLDILPKNAICAETTLENSILNCVISVYDSSNNLRDLRFWCSIEHDACVEQFDQLAGIIEAKEKQMAGPSAKQQRQAAISEAMNNN